MKLCSRLIVLAVIGICGAWVASAYAASGEAKTRSAGPRVLHLRWRRVWADGVGALSADGNYVLFGFDQSNAAVLIDDRTGLQTALSPPPLFGPTGAKVDCSIGRIGVPWVVAYCRDGSTALYSIPDRSWRVVRAPPSYSPGPPAADSPSAVGRHWIEWARLVHGGPCCNYASFYYQNIATATVRADPTTNSTMPDLDSPSLARTLCSPLRMPASYNDHANGLGSIITLNYGFVLARSQLPAIPNPLFSNAPSGTVVYLERCGSHLRRTIIRATGFDASYPAANRNMVVWLVPGARQSQLRGLSLPSLRQFVIQTPFVGPRYVSQLVAGSQNLYATVVTLAPGRDLSVEVWSTRNPRLG